MKKQISAAINLELNDRVIEIAKKLHLKYYEIFERALEEYIDKHSDDSYCIIEKGETKIKAFENDIKQLKNIMSLQKTKIETLESQVVELHKSEQCKNVGGSN